VDGEDSGGGCCERECVLKVDECWAQTAQEARDADRHAQRLAARGELYRLDSVRDELRVPCDRGEAQIARRGGGELAQEAAYVRFVAGSLPAEHVRVEDDERQAHAAASR
jgi:hypothetical protein